MAVQTTDFGRVADDLRRAAGSFALLTSNASAFGAALNSFREFERQLVLTNAIALGTVETYAKMERAARGFALATTTSATEAASALQNLAQAGFTAQESISAMTGVLLLASATMSDVNVAADLISSNIRAFGLQASDTARVANLFTAAMNRGLATIDKLTYAMRQVAPVANVANLSIEETTSWLNVLFNVGLRGEQAGTALRNVIVRLVRPTGEAAQTLRKFGIATTDATGNMRELETILKELDAANLGEAQLAKIFENEALAGAITMMKATRTEVGKTTNAYRQMLQQISGTQAALQLALANMDSFDGSMKLLRNSINDAAITLGEEFAPYIRELAKFIRDLLTEFRNLDPETRKFYVQMAAVGVALMGALASLNAFILLFGGAASAISRAAIGLSGILLGRLVFALDAVGIAFTAIVSGQLTVAGAITALSGVFAGFARTLIGPFVMAAEAATAALVALGLTPIGAAIAVTVAVVGAAGLAMRAFADDTDAATEAQRRLRVEAEKAQAKKSFDKAASNVGIGEFTILDAQRQLQMNTQLVSSDLVNSLGENDYKTAINAAEVGQTNLRTLRESLIKQRDALAAVFDQADGINAAVEAERARAEKYDRSFIGGFSNFFTSTTALEDVNRALDEDYAGVIEQSRLFKLKKEKLEELIAETQLQQDIGVQAEKERIKGFVEAIATGGQQLDPLYADLNKSVSDFLRAADEGTIKAIVDGLSEGEKNFTQESFLEAVLKAQGVDPQFIKVILDRRAKERIRKVVYDLQSIAAAQQADLDKLKIESLKFTSKNGTDLAEAIRAGGEAAYMATAAEMKKILGDFAKDNGEALSNTIIQSQDGVQEAIDAAVKQGGYSDPDKLGIEKIIGGQWLIDAIEKRITADTSKEEAQRIIEEEAKKYGILLENMLNLIGETMKQTVTEDQLNAIRTIAGNQVQLISAAALNGVSDATKAAEDARERFDREKKAAAAEAERAKKAARDAIKEARKIEDAFREISRTRRDLQDTVTTNTRGVDVADRIKSSYFSDVLKITRDYEDQIRDLKRQIEDIEVNFTGSPQELARLKQQYGELITEMKAAQAAEIASAGEFTAQMERRSKALETFMRDLKDIGMASKDTFTQVGAGIATAFAEYNKDLVTIIDITKDATSSMLDTITSGIGDFIFDNTNAWENFKKSMLNISRQIFEGFTKAFLQQSISSITGGEGSIFGNALQPSGFGNTGTPGVGTGGILGKLFPGLAGAFGKQTAGTQADPMQQALTAAATQTNQVYTQHLTQLRSILSNFATGLQGALSSVTGGAGTGIGTALTGATDALTGGAATAVTKSVATITGATTDLAQGIYETAKSIGANPIDLAKAISFETGGTFDPLIKGPTTKWGQHRGLIQWGEDQARQYGVDFSSAQAAMSSQLGADGAIARYFKDRGFMPGMSGLDLYSTINAGSPGRYNASDTAAGGTWGTVADKWNSQMEGHLANAEQLFSNFNGDLAQTVGDTQGLVDTLSQNIDPAAATNLIGQTPGILPPGQYGASGNQAVAGTGGNPLTSILGIGGGQAGANDPTGVMSSAQQLNTVMTQFVTQITTTLNQFGTQFTAALNNALAQMGGGSVSFGGIGGGAGGGIGGLFSSIGSLFGFSKGGYTGNGGKYEPAGVVHRGEYVTNSDATKAFYPLLDAINSGDINPRYADTMLAAMGLRNKGVKTKQSDSYATGGLVGGIAGMAGLSNAMLGSNVRNTTNPVPQVSNPITLQASYVVNMNGGNGDNFARSANQHAKKLMAAIEKAKRNT